MKQHCIQTSFLISNIAMKKSNMTDGKVSQISVISDSSPVQQQQNIKATRGKAGLSSGKRGREKFLINNGGSVISANNH
jgi:hypothetical protein